MNRKVTKQIENIKNSIMLLKLEFEGKFDNASYEMIYTADDEEPNCLHCDNQNYCFRKLLSGEYVEETLCGADYGWRLYKRTELE